VKLQTKQSTVQYFYPVLCSRKMRKKLVNSIKNKYLDNEK
jgi:hypothetical protein